MSTVTSEPVGPVEGAKAGPTRAVILLVSYHHRNTEKVAQAIAGVLGAEIRDPRTDGVNVSEYDLVGFGSGIYSGKHHRALLDLVDGSPSVDGKKAFLFSTSGRTGKVMAKYHRPLRDKLEAKGFAVVDEFNCAGFDTVGPKGLVGGIKKGHPDRRDIEQAAAFARKLGQRPERPSMAAGQNPGRTTENARGNAI